MEKEKILVAMSGGVDSSVAAAILKDQGYEIAGATLKLFDYDDDFDGRTRTCCSIDDVEDARSVAYRLDIPYYVFNFKDEFKKNVIGRFGNIYRSGRTPNPCIDCNRFIKFDKMINRALTLGYDKIATGHYAQVEFNEKTGRYLLKKAGDGNKDQTYVLYSLTQDQLSRTLFPLNQFKKEEIREIAQDKDLIVARKPDSQDICFVPDGDYEKFLREKLDIKIQEGDFLDTEGNFLGRHPGFINFTIGQRKGLGIALGRPMYVVDIRPEKNHVILGSNEDLFKTQMEVGDLNLIMFDNLEEPMDVDIKVRYSQGSIPGQIYPKGEDRIQVKFKEPVRAITPGQAAVFYQGDYVVGGGTIL